MKITIAQLRLTPAQKRGLIHAYKTFKAQSGPVASGWAMADDIDSRTLKSLTRRGLVYVTEFSGGRCYGCSVVGYEVAEELLRQ